MAQAKLLLTDADYESIKILAAKTRQTPQALMRNAVLSMLRPVGQADKRSEMAPNRPMGELFAVAPESDAALAAAIDAITRDIRNYARAAELSRDAHALEAEAGDLIDAVDSLAQDARENRPGHSPSRGRTQGRANRDEPLKP